jgi:SWI/SNF-related matrix-associated actin-dependent regulator of chromatin subfamily A-like protein 1
LETGKQHLSIEQEAIDLLEKYEGSNNYILRIKKQCESNKKHIPTRAQCEYVITYYNTTPKVAKKWVDIDSYFSKKLVEDNPFIKEPDKIYIEKLLVEKDKSYHIWGKVFSGDTIHDFWVPKAAVIKEYKENIVNVDYSKYDNRPPLSHQKEAIEKLLKNDKFILADDMGLGKTTSTVIASLESGSKKTLIICPASLKINWEREIKNYTDKTVYICEGKKFEDADYIITNYDILKNFHDPKDKENSILLKSKFDLVVIDEAHYVSNAQAQRTKIIMDLTKNIKKLWLLTGTPMTSRPMNYYNILKLIDSPVSQNWMAYAIRYCNGYQFRVGSKKVWNVTGASNLEELRDRTSRQILRRLKTDVLDLPDKIMTPVYLRLKSRLYEGLMGEYYDWYNNRQDESKSLSVQFTKLMKVRQVLAEEKISHTIELAENIIEQGKKVIIFSNFTEPLKKIHEHFGKKSVYLDGSTTKPARQDAVDKFQESDKIQVFCGNIKAAGVGLTLTAAEACIMNDLSFVPAEHSQAEDRAYRYGQKNTVSIYYPIFENTIEGVIYDILDRKKKIIGTVMGDLQETDADIVEQILKEINNR